MIGDRIKKVRKHFHLKLTDFGKMLKKSASHVSEIETEKANPSESLILLISQVFKVSEQWLLTGQGEMFNESEGVHEPPAIYGLSEDERQIIELLRENPELKVVCIKLLKNRQSFKETLEELQRIAKLQPDET